MVHNYISIVGAGAFGTAIAHVLAANGHWVCLYTHEAAVATAVNQTHTNPTYLPDVQLPPTVWATTDPAVAARGDMLFVATPVPYLRSALAPFKELITLDDIVVLLCKGIEASTGALPHEVVGETVGPCQLAVLGGPNFAKELTQPGIAGAVVAAHDKNVAQRVFDVVDSEQLRVTLSDDLVGVQLCGALKNVIALGLGIVTGRGAGDNERVYLLTHALHEVAVVVKAYGGRRSTVFGLAGLGDTVLSSLSTQGRNYRLGIMLGQGTSATQALQTFASSPEGLNTVRALRVLVARQQLELPVLMQVCEHLLGD